MKVAMYIWAGVTFLALPSFLIGAVVLAVRRPTNATRLLAVSLGVACLGQILQWIVPYRHSTTSIGGTEGVMVVNAELPAAWYLGSLLISFGIMAAIASFVWFAFTDRPASGSRQSNNAAQSDARDEAARAAGRER
jgi:hypothetical protein